MNLLHDLPCDEATPGISDLREKLQQLETELWQNPLDQGAAARYQQAFRDYEDLIAGTADAERRSHFIVVIPVADRPLQLERCIHSIFKLCELYRYGGYCDNRYTRVTVVVADDSADADNISCNREMCTRYNDEGLDVIYFGQDEQLRTIETLSDAELASIRPFIGDAHTGIQPPHFSHKGASIMRNLCNLYLRDLCQRFTRPLVYYIDSDQEFCINLDTDTDNSHYLINYFHHIDRIFATTRTQLLTGKIVGAPPVSPAVMVGNFLDDVIAFLQTMSALDAGDACQFHELQHTSDGAYHDMADLFGLADRKQTYDYQCNIPGQHSNADCMAKFSSLLDDFFHGEHPTRCTSFSYDTDFSDITSARTVYTGNYVFKPELLATPIAFAELRLRMAGPTLGRLLRSSLGEGFASANLPMLHSRAIGKSNGSEFRTDINTTNSGIDLSGEFERQYYGDVMLFSIEKLCELGYPEKELHGRQIEDTLKQVDASIHERYISAHEDILDKVSRLRAILDSPASWWNGSDTQGTGIRQFHRFIDNVIANFGENSATITAINDDDSRHDRLKSLATAITEHRQATAAWDRLFR